MEPFTLAWAAEVLGARIIGETAEIVTGVCTDTRQGARGALFFALQGENSDGHEYVAQAFAQGAVAAVVSRELEDAPGPLLVVPDTLRALGDLAMRYREQFAIPVVGVTGSVGKTSTKEMIAAVLRPHYNVLASDKNFNNEIGVPLTLFQMTKAHTAAVIEMGMRGLGEIDRLAEIAQPTIGVITQIGYAHIERLGSQENIARAKSELFARLPPGGFAIMSADTACWNILQERVADGCRILYFSTAHTPQADVRLCPKSVRMQSDGSVSFRARVGKLSPNLPISLRAAGVHHVPNALAALAVTHVLSVPLPEAVAALEQWTGAEGRMVVRNAPDGWTILDDCYNAGPESMKAALKTLRQMAEGGVAVLGDMKELGSFAPEAHRQIGKEVFASNARLLVTVGELARDIRKQTLHFARGFGNNPPITQHFPDSEQAAAAIRKLVRPGDTILVKGSRAMQMEKIVAALMTSETDNPAPRL